MRTTALAAAIAVALLAAPARPSPVHRGPQSGVAIVTGYCSACSGSIGLHDRTLRVGQCAADLRYHPEGSRVWIEGHGTLTVRDVGGAIKGPNRFDVYQGTRSRCTCGHDVGRQQRHWEAR